MQPQDNQSDQPIVPQGETPYAPVPIPPVPPVSPTEQYGSIEAAAAPVENNIAANAPIDQTQTSSQPTPTAYGAAPTIENPTVNVGSNQSQPQPPVTSPSWAAPQVATAPEVALGAATVSSAPTVAPKKGLKKWLIAAVIAVPLLAGSAAAAYVGVVVPNQPENALKIALVNTIQEKDVVIDGFLDLGPANKTKSSEVPSSNVKFAFGVNADKTFTGTADLVITGIKVSAELRYIDENLYVKTGDLTTVARLAEGYVPGATTLASKVHKQWIEADKTIMTQMGASCYLTADTALSEADIKALNEAYDKNGFAQIQSVSTDTVGDKNAKKFELLLDDNKLAEFIENDIAKVSGLKGLQDCAKNDSDAKLDLSQLKDDDKTPLTLWVVNKKIVKIASKSTDMDAKKSNLKGSFVTSLSYKKTTVEKPTGAKPVMTLLSELQQDSAVQKLLMQ